MRSRLSRKILERFVFILIRSYVSPLMMVLLRYLIVRICIVKILLLSKILEGIILNLSPGSLPIVRIVIRHLGLLPFLGKMDLWPAGMFKLYSIHIIFLILHRLLSSLSWTKAGRTILTMAKRYCRCSMTIVHTDWWH